MKVAKRDKVSKSRNPQGAVTFVLPSKSYTPLQRRARRRSVSKPLAELLMRVTPSLEMKKSYERTATKCQEKMFQTGGKLHTAYCSNRWCLVCSSYRQVRMYASYGQEVLSWKNSAYFVTLTIPNVSAIELRSSIQKMHKVFRLCWRYMREKEGLEVQMVRATEITWNGETKKFHPHMHCIIRGKRQAVALVRNWVKRWPEASILAQDIRKADRGSIYEAFKYTSKLISTEVKDADGFGKLVPPVQLDKIFRACRGLRLWCAVGVKSALGEVGEEDALEMEQNTPTPKRVDEELMWEWGQAVRDWIDYETGDVLSDHEPSQKVERFVKKLEDELDH